MAERPRAGRTRGRPSDESIDRALLDAALAEFTERGYHAMSMESIAARAGVSKVSLYRRWSGKPDIMGDVFRLMSELTPAPDQGSFEADIRALLEQYIGSNAASDAGKLLLRTMGEISGDAELLALYRKHLLEPRMDQLRGLVTKARDRGELLPDLAIDVACAIIAGPLFLYYLTLLAQADLALPADLVEHLTRSILRGVAK